MKILYHRNNDKFQLYSNLGSCKIFNKISNLSPRSKNLYLGNIWFSVPTFVLSFDSHNNVYKLIYRQHGIIRFHIICNFFISSIEFLAPAILFSIATSLIANWLQFIWISKFRRSETYWNNSEVLSLNCDWLNSWNTFYKPFSKFHSIIYIVQIEQILFKRFSRESTYFDDQYVIRRFK